MTVLILDTVDFRTKPRHFIMIKRSIQQKDVTILNVVAHNSFQMHKAKPARA